MVILLGFGEPPAEIMRKSVGNPHCRQGEPIRENRHIERFGSNLRHIEFNRGQWGILIVAVGKCSCRQSPADKAEQESRQSETRNLGVSMPF
jgi:hypothetical protein